MSLRQAMAGFMAAGLVACVGGGAASTGVEGRRGEHGGGDVDLEEIVSMWIWRSGGGHVYLDPPFYVTDLLDPPFGWPTCH